jgi:hypothetical protein
MRLIQFEVNGGGRRVAAVEGSENARVINGATTVRELALAAIASARTLAAQIESMGWGPHCSYPQLLREQRVLPPLDHPDPAHCLVTGTGLTHLGSAATRDSMHQKLAADEASLTDSMRIFKWGMEGGKPGAGRAGVQPEWFYKSDGALIVRPGAAFPLPDFSDDGGEEAEIAALYVIAPDGTPHRVGYALGNEFSDHVMEKKNYLYLAHSKLRASSIGPELLLGALPARVTGHVRIRRNGKVIWEKEFLSGEDNMCHALGNLEFHHFKYDQFLRPGDVHIHYLGAATLSFADGVLTQEGDQFEIDVPAFGAPLVNPVKRVPHRCRYGAVRAL